MNQIHVPEFFFSCYKFVLLARCKTTGMKQNSLTLLQGTVSMGKGHRKIYFHH
jgi:hypothetical protein